MRAGPLVGAAVRAFVVGITMIAVGCSGSDSKGVPGGGGPNHKPHEPKTRENVIVLLPSGNGCRAVKPDPVRGYKTDTIRWTVYDACGSVTEVGINFTTFGSPDDGSGKLDDKFNNSQARLSLRIKQDLSGVTADPSTGVWTFPYQIWIVRNGQRTTLQDPDLEVDPWTI